MNHDPRFPVPGDEREWAAQERALADERAGLAPHGDAPRLRSYRLVAHVLAQPPDEQLPPGFARRVAQQVQQDARSADARLERYLLAALVAAMAVAAVAAIAVYGTQWLPAFDRGTAGALVASPWPWALAACLGLSRLSRHWWLQHGHHA